METTDKGLVAQIEQRFLAELAGEPVVAPRLIEGLSRMVRDGQLQTESLLLQLFQQAGADQP